MGDLLPDGDKWVSCRKGFFLSVRVMSRLFRGKFLDYLRKSYDSQELIFPGNISHLQESEAFREFLKGFYSQEWVVYCKPPFKCPEMVLEYLGRYTHRIAIGNHRILKIEDGKVSFLWRDYADGNRNKIMTLDAFEFIRRFLLHVLPDRFVKIRYYGLLGNRNRKAMLSKCRKFLGVITVKVTNRDVSETWQEFLLRVCGINLMRCPFCGKGIMVRKAVLLPERYKEPP